MNLNDVQKYMGITVIEGVINNNIPIMTSLTMSEKDDWNESLNNINDKQINFNYTVFAFYKQEFFSSGPGIS